MTGAAAIARAVRAGEQSARTACEAALERVRASRLGAVWEHDPAAALAAADAVDAAVARGRDPGPLAGVPVVVKDAFDVAGLPGGGGVPGAGPAEVDADAVASLRRAGAVVLGKAAMHQLGWGMRGQSPGRPLCRNPLDPSLQPGGSSSGSAVAVAADLVPVSLGGDTGGSVRQPAAWCRIVGYKPAQAAVSRAGLLPLAPPLDTVGWFGRDIDDVALVGQALGAPAGPVAAEVRGLRVAVDDAVLERCDPVVAGAVEDALRGLEALGVRRVAEPLPGFPARLGPLYAAELALAWEERVAAEPELFGEDVRAGVEAGRTVTAVEYLRIAREREAARCGTRIVADAVVCPTCPILPPRLDEPDDVRRAGLLTRPFNLLDWPAISVPVGEAPVGLQIATPRGGEPALWALARAVERGR